jgi:hypothetical protein
MSISDRHTGNVLIPLCVNVIAISTTFSKRNIFHCPERLYLRLFCCTLFQRFRFIFAYCTLPTQAHKKVISQCTAHEYISPWSSAPHKPILHPACCWGKIKKQQHGMARSLGQKYNTHCSKMGSNSTRNV